MPAPAGGASAEGGTMDCSPPGGVHVHSRPPGPPVPCRRDQHRRAARRRVAPCRSAAGPAPLGLHHRLIIQLEDGLALGEQGHRIDPGGGRRQRAGPGDGRRACRRRWTWSERQQVGQGVDRAGAPRPAPGPPGVPGRRGHPAGPGAAGDRRERPAASRGWGRAGRRRARLPPPTGRARVGLPPSACPSYTTW